MIMVSVLEKQYMETVIRMGRRMNSGEIDWEQRRYEIAKDCLAASMPFILKMAGNMAMVNSAVVDLAEPVLTEATAEMAVGFADVLVAKLKNPVRKNPEKE